MMAKDSVKKRLEGRSENAKIVLFSKVVNNRDYISAGVINI
jgi:hypothetical protein